MIKVKNLSKSYFTKGKSRTIFKNLNFTINSGDYFGTGKVPDMNQGPFLFKTDWKIK